MATTRLPALFSIMAVSTILLATAQGTATASALSEEPDTLAPSQPAPSATPPELGAGLSSWEVDRLNGCPLLRGTSITANFADGTVSGSAGCNLYTASYIAENGMFLLTSPIATTLRYCSPPDVMTQEAKYLTALKDARAYTLEGGSLILRDDNGAEIIRFVAPPL